MNASSQTGWDCCRGFSRDSKKKIIFQLECLHLRQFASWILLLMFYHWNIEIEAARNNFSRGEQLEIETWWINWKETSSKLLNSIYDLSRDLKEAAIVVRVNYESFINSWPNCAFANCSCEACREQLESQYCLLLQLPFITFQTFITLALSSKQSLTQVA